MENPMVITVFISFDFDYIPLFIYYSCQYNQGQCPRCNARNSCNPMGHFAEIPDTPQTYYGEMKNSGYPYC